VPFLAFPPEVRRVIYTTNLIEWINALLRKVTRNRGQFPSEQAALKVLYLAVRNLDEYRRPNVCTRSSAGNKRSKRSRSTSRDASPHHDRHDHLPERRTPLRASECPAATAGPAADILVDRPPCPGARVPMLATSGDRRVCTICAGDDGRATAGHTG